MNEKTDYSEILKKRRNPDSEFYSMVNFVLVLLLIFALFSFTFTKIFIGVRVCGSSMSPTLYGGEQDEDGFYHKGNYLFVCTLMSPSYGDIIVFDSVEGQGKLEVIKRVVGLPGDRLFAENGVLYRTDCNGDFAKVEEPYIIEGWKGSFEEQSVPNDCVFVLGDNRLNSTDSRSYGAVPLSRVLGVVTDISLILKDIITPIFNLFDRRAL